jgi:hypothetical protein
MKNIIEEQEFKQDVCLVPSTSFDLRILSNLSIDLNRREGVFRTKVTIDF